MCDRKKLHNTLKQMRDLANGKGDDIRFRNTIGICKNLQNFSDGEFNCEHIRKYYESWPKFSGSVIFPVPSDLPSNANENDTLDKEVAAMNKEHAALERFVTVINMWAGDYGKLRMELLQYLIRCTR